MLFTNAFFAPRHFNSALADFKEELGKLDVWGLGVMAVHHGAWVARAEEGGQGSRQSSLGG